MPNPDLPGRLGDPERSLGTDPRLDPRLKATLSKYDLLTNGEAPPLKPDAPIEQIVEFGNAAEQGFAGMFADMFSTVPPVPGIDRSTATVTGDDGNEIILYIHRPANAEGPLPAIYHTHGGGMVLLSADNAEYQWWRDRQAAEGFVVIGVEFRNGAGALGPFPFPAGLRDCLAGLRYVASNKTELGISHIVISGESGGGNLAIATTLAARREGDGELVAGVYAECPYISGAWADPPAELTSLHENNAYFLRCDMMSLLAAAYTPETADLTDPLAWPLHTDDSELQGFPPTVISVNELDPLRDEGLHFLRKLWKAGVTARGRITPGTTHAGDILLAPVNAMEITDATASDIATFVRSVG